MIHNSKPEHGRLLHLLTIIDGPNAGGIHQRLPGLLDAYRQRLSPTPAAIGSLAPSDRDVILITYGVQVTRQDEPPPANVAPDSAWLRLIDGRAFPIENGCQLQVTPRPYGFECLVLRPAVERVDARSS